MTAIWEPHSDYLQAHDMCLVQGNCSASNLMWVIMSTHGIVINIKLDKKVC